MIRLDIINFIFCIIILIISIYIIVNMSKNNCNKSNEKYTIETGLTCPFKSNGKDQNDPYYPGGADCPTSGQNNNTFLLADKNGNISTSNMTVQNYCDFEKLVNQIYDITCKNRDNITTLNTTISNLQNEVYNLDKRTSSDDVWKKLLSVSSFAGFGYQTDIYDTSVMLFEGPHNVADSINWRPGSSGITNIIILKGWQVTLSDSKTTKTYTNTTDQFLYKNARMDLGISNYSATSYICTWVGY